jgi:hypothetical protein
VLVVSHLLFVDDVLCFCWIDGRDNHTLKEVLTLFNKATRMEINVEILTMYLSSVRDDNIEDLTRVLPFWHHQKMDLGFRYLGYNI